MVATIQLSPYIQIQGFVARTLPDGFVAILDGGREYIGRPLCRKLRAGAKLSVVEADLRG